MRPKATIIISLLMVAALIWVVALDPDPASSSLVEDITANDEVDRPAILDPPRIREGTGGTEGHSVGPNKELATRFLVLTKVDESPVPGARVYLCQEVRFDRPLREWLDDPERFRLLGTTDREGELILDERVDGVVFARDGQLVSEPSVASSDGSYVLHLPERSAITIRLTQAGAPVEGEQIKLEELSVSRDHWKSQAVTDVDGEAVFERVPSGGYAASTSGELGTAYAWVYSKGEPERVELELEAGRTIQVQVVDRDTGDAVLGASISTRTPLIPSDWEEVGPGVFRTGPIPSDLTVWVLEVEAPSFAANQFELRVMQGAEDSIHTLSLAAGQKVTGRLVDFSSLGVSGADTTLTAFRWDGAPQNMARIKILRTTISSADGAFEFYLPADLKLETMVAIAPNGGICTLDLEGRDLLKPVELGDCLVLPCAKLDLSVVDLDGQTLNEKLRVVVSPAGMESHRELRRELWTSPEEVRFELDGLPASQVRVRCLRENRVVAQAEVDLAEGGGQLQLYVPSPRQLDVRLMDSMGSALNGAIRVEVAGQIHDEVQIIQGVAQLRNLPDNAAVTLIWIGSDEAVEVGATHAGRNSQAFQLSLEGVFRRVPWPDD